MNEYIESLEPKNKDFNTCTSNSQPIGFKIKSGIQENVNNCILPSNFTNAGNFMNVCTSLQEQTGRDDCCDTVDWNITPTGIGAPVPDGSNDLVKNRSNLQGVTATADNSLGGVGTADFTPIRTDLDAESGGVDRLATDTRWPQNRTGSIMKILILLKHGWMSGCRLRDMIHHLMIMNGI